MNNTNATKPARRTTKDIFLDELLAVIENGYPTVQPAIDLTTGMNVGRFTLYEDLDPVLVIRFNFQADYARFAEVGTERSTGWGNGMPPAPREAFDAIVGWIDEAVQ